MSETCGARKADGSRCTSTVALCVECGRCTAHCEHRKGVRDAARSKGGRTVAKRKEGKRQGAKAVAYMPAKADEVPPAPKTAEDGKAYLAWLLDAGARGEMGGALARDLSTVCDRFIRAVGTADLERQIREMREEMAAMREER